MKPEEYIGKEFKIPYWDGIYIVESITYCSNLVLGQCKKKDVDEKTRYPINILILKEVEKELVPA